MAAAGSDEPERTRASQVISSRLMSEPQYQAVLKLVEKYLPKFDLINMVGAMHICAVTARDHELLKKQIQYDPSFIELFHTTKGEVLKDVAVLSTRTTSDLLWSCARLGIFDSELFNAVVADASLRLESYSAQGIGMLVFALGVVEQRPRAAFIQALVRELRSRIANEFDPQNITMIVYGMMRLGIRDDRLMKIVSEHLRRLDFDEVESISVTCLVYAYAKLGYWDQEVWSLLGRATVARLNDLEPQLISMAVLGFAQATVQVQESTFTMEKIMAGVESRLDTFDNRSLSTFSFAAGKYRQITESEEGRQRVLRFKEPDPTAKFIIEEISKRTLESFTMSEVNLLNYSFMRLEHRDPEFLKMAARQFARNAAELTSLEIVNAVYAFGRMQFIHLPFVAAMVGEVKRRRLLDSMTNLELATLAYSLSLNRLVEDELMDRIACIICERVRQCSGQVISMTLWALAVVNCRKNADALVSAVLEDMTQRPSHYEPLSTAISLWAIAILSGATSALRIMELLFSSGFWAQGFDEAACAMIYHAYTALRAEAGIPMEELRGWVMCRRLYEELTGATYGEQHQRLATRLRMQQITHQANTMVPTLEGHREAGMRADIVLEKLTLIIEVEGPQRMTIPLDKVMTELGGEEVCGKPEDVIMIAREAVELPLTGSAAFKRRLLRKCGWRVVTVTFDENEEYIAEALNTMANKKKKAAAGDGPAQEAEAAAEAAPPEDAGAQPMTENLGAEEFSFSEAGAMVEEEESNLSEYEVKLRERHREALEELRRRILEGTGDAAKSAEYSNHVEYRKWQVGLEREVFREMMATL